MNIESIVDLNTDNAEHESYLPDAEKIISGKPQQNIWNVFSSGDEKFHCGIWDSKDGSWQVSYSEEEFCLILEGESIIHDADGNTKTVRAGDQFIVPAGFGGRWEVPTYCKKVYVIYEA